MSDVLTFLLPLCVKKSKMNLVIAVKVQESPPLISVLIT